MASFLHLRTTTNIGGSTSCQEHLCALRDGDDLSGNRKIAVHLLREATKQGLPDTDTG